MYESDWTSLTPAALAVRDEDRLPQYANRGDMIVINPVAFESWNREEVAKSDRMLYMVANPAMYSRYGAEPIRSGSNVHFAPIDLLAAADQHKILLHEASELLSSFRIKL